MGLSVSYEQRARLLVAHVTGVATLEELCDLADSAADHALRHRSRCVLFDFLGAQMKLSFTEHMQLGMHVAHSLRHLDKIATAAQAADRTGVSEKVVQRHGVRLKSFASAEEALAWLAVGEQAG